MRMPEPSFGLSSGPGRRLEPPTNTNADRFGKAEECVLEHRKLETVGDGRSDLFRLDQIRLAQDCKMRRERWLGKVEVLGDVPGRHRPFSLELEDPPSRRIGQCLEDKVHILIIS